MNCNLQPSIYTFGAFHYGITHVELILIVQAVVGDETKKKAIICCQSVAEWWEDKLFFHSHLILFLSDHLTSKILNNSTLKSLDLGKEELAKVMSKEAKT